MPISKLQDSSCAVSRSLSVLGERWTLLILRLAFEGETRFEAFRSNLGVAPDVLTDRLTTLVEYGIMTKQAYQEPGSRGRYEYHLTPVGRELHVIIAGLQQWGDTHLPRKDGPTVVRRRHETEAPVRVAFVDGSGCEVPLDQVDAVRTASYPRSPVSKTRSGDRTPRAQHIPARLFLATQPGGDTPADTAPPD